MKLETGNAGKGGPLTWLLISKWVKFKPQVRPVPPPPCAAARHPAPCAKTQPGHRIPAWWGVAGPSGGHPAQPPAQAGSPRAGCTAPCPGGAGISPEKETPQPPWTAWARAPSPSEGRSSSSGSAGASSASVCARCPLFCRWALLKRGWPHPPDTHPSDIFKHL